MKIIDIRLIELRCPLAVPVKMSFGLRTERRHLFVEVHTDDGVIGLGDTWTNFPFWAVDERKITLESLKRFFIGKDPLNRNDIWADIQSKILLSDIGLQYGSKGPVYQALSGIDIALWDIAGKAQGVPVYKLLGGKLRDSVPAYASGLSAGDYVTRIPRLLEEGFTEFKVKVGFGEAEDDATLAGARKLIGNHTLYADSNQKWLSADDALINMRNLRRHGVVFFEEPVNASRLDMYARIREQEPTLVLAAGENGYGRGDFHMILKQGLADIIQPDITKCGGITETWAVCEEARNYGVKTALHMYGTAVGLAASLHVMLASPLSYSMEYDVLGNVMMTDLPGTCFYELKNGRFDVVRDMPGIGIELDKEFVEKYRV